MQLANFVAHSEDASLEFDMNALLAAASKLTTVCDRSGTQKVHKRSRTKETHVRDRATRNLAERKGAREERLLSLPVI